MARREIPAMNIWTKLVSIGHWQGSIITIMVRMCYGDMLRLILMTLATQYRSGVNLVELVSTTFNLSTLSRRLFQRTRVLLELAKTRLRYLP